MANSEVETASWVKWVLTSLIGLLVFGLSGLATLTTSLDASTAASLREIRVDRTLKWISYEKDQGKMAVCLAEIKVDLRQIKDVLAEVKEQLKRRR